MIGFVHDDGGRSAAGFRGQAGDCVARALALVTRRPYLECYRALADAERAAGRPRSARNGVHRHVYEPVFAAFGLRNERLGSGPKPTWSQAHERFGDCIVKTRRHVAGLIDNALHDTADRRTYTWPVHPPTPGSPIHTVRERKAASVWSRR